MKLHAPLRFTLRVFALLTLVAAPLAAQTTLYWAGAQNFNTWNGTLMTWATTPGGSPSTAWSNGSNANLTLYPYVSITLGKDISVGSITGVLDLSMNGHDFTVGANNTNTDFSQGYANGSGAIIKVGSGTLTMATIMDQTGLIINGGVVVATSDNSLGATNGGSLTLDGGTLRWGASFNIGNNRSVTLGAGGGIFDTNGFNATRSGAITGSGSLTKTGSGTLTLSAVNSYAGATIINGGTLSLGVDNALPDATAVTVASGAVFNVNGRTDTIGSLAGAGNVTLGAGALTAGGDNTSTTLSGVISGTGSLQKAGTGTLTLSGANTFSGATTISAGTLTLGHSLALQNSTVTVSGGALSFGSLTSSTFGGLTGSTDLALTNGSSATVALSLGNNNASTTYSGVLSGGGSLTKVGSGTLTLSGNNTYTGGTTISAGTLQLGAGAATGLVAGNIVDNGTLAINRSDNVTLSGIISGTGNLTKSGANTLILSGNNTFSGTTTISAGTLRLGHEFALQSSTVSVASGATLSMSTTSPNVYQATIGGLSGAGNVVVNDTLSIGNNNADTTFSGVISGSSAPFNADVVKVGTGTLTLSGTNTYWGVTSVRDGLIEFSSLANFGPNSISLNGGGVRWASGTTTDISARLGYGIVGSFGVLDTNGNNVTLASSIGGTGRLVKTGAGTLTLSGVNSYGSGTTIAGGTLSIGANENLGPNYGHAFIFDGGTLKATGSFNLDQNLQVGSGGGTLDTNGNTITNFSGLDSGSGAFTKTGAGTLIFSGSSDYSTYTGNTTINAGTVQFASERNFGTGTITVNGATLQWGAFGIDPSSRLVLGSAGATLDTNGFDVTLASALTGTGALTKTGGGTLIFNGAQTYTGGTTISSGTLQLGDGGTTGSLSGNIVNNGTLSIWRNGAMTLTNLISGTGDLYVQNAAITLAAANTFSGSTTIYGSLTLGHSLALQNSTLIVPWVSSMSFGSLTSATIGAISATSVGSPNLALTNASSAAVALTVGNNNVSTTYAGTLSGLGSLTKIGTGTLTLSGNNGYAGTTTINGGALAIDADVRLGSAPGTATAGKLALDGGTLATTATFTLNANRGIALNAGGGTFQADSGTTFAYGGIAAGTGGLTKTGSGTLSLSGANTYTGATAVSAGTLQLGANNTLPDSSALFIASGATLDVNGRTETIASLTGAGGVSLGGGALTIGAAGTSTTFAGTLSGSGTLAKTGAGTLTLTGSASTGGGTTISAGTLQVGANGTSGSLAGSVAVASGATLNFARSNGVTFSDTITGSGNVTHTGAGTLTFDGATPINLAGTLTLATTAGAVNFGSAGHTLGTLAMTTGNVTTTGGSLTLTNGISAVSNDASHSHTSGTIAGSLILGGAVTVDVRDNTPYSDYTLDITANISGSGSLARTGFGNGSLPNLKLSGANTYTGTTSGSVLLGNSLALQNSTLTGFASFGTLIAATLGGLGGSSNLSLTNTSSAAVAVSIGNNHSSTTYTGVLSGAGNVTKIGNGTLTLSGANTYTGGTTINAGTIQLGASSRLASTGALTLGGGAFATGGFSQTLGLLTLAATSTIDFGSGTSAVAFANSSAATWSGTLSILNYTSGTDTLRFGTNSTSLTSLQLAQINFGPNLLAQIDSSGFVTAVSAIPEPSTYAALCGGAGLLLVLFRHHRRKLR